MPVGAAVAGLSGLASSSAIQAYQDGTPFAAIPLTNVVDDEELAISFAHQNGEAVAKVMSIDWIKVGQFR